jgi:hypothetical protein
VRQRREERGERREERGERREERREMREMRDERWMRKENSTGSQRVFILEEILYRLFIALPLMVLNPCNLTRVTIR